MFREENKKKIYIKKIYLNRLWREQSIFFIIVYNKESSKRNMGHMDMEKTEYMFIRE